MQKSVKKNIVFFFILLSTLSVYGQNAQLTLKKADSLFSAKRYSQAIKVYESLLQNNHTSPSMLLKMAYIYEANNDYTQAQYCLTHYTRLTNDLTALDKQSNLAKKYALKGYDNPEQEQIWFSIMPYTQYIVLSLLTMAAILVFVQFWFSKQNVKRLVFPILTTVFLLFAVFLQTIFQQPKVGIVSADKTYAMSGPSAAANVSQIIRKGSRFEIMDYTDVWVKVKLNEDVYFVRQEDLLTIAP